MSDLAKPVKSYYLIEEAFNRLKRAGADLDKPEDVYLLAAQNDIQVHLALQDTVTLIKESDAKPHFLSMSNRFRWSFRKDNVNFALNELNYSEADLAKEIHQINNPSLMIPCSLYEGNSDDAIKKVELEADIGEMSEPEVSSHYPVNLHLFFDRPKVVKPMQLEINHAKAMFNPPKEYDFLSRLGHAGVGLGAECAVNWNNEIYYTCSSTDASYFSAMVRYKVTFKSGRVYFPKHQLNGWVIPELRQARSLVVKKKSILNFEQEHLSINHEVSTNKLPPYLDPFSDLYAKELDIAIKAHTAIFTNKEGQPHGSNGRKVENWLEKHYPKESESNAFRERMKSVILPKKK